MTLFLPFIILIIILITIVKIRLHSALLTSPSKQVQTREACAAPVNLKRATRQTANFDSTLRRSH